MAVGLFITGTSTGVGKTYVGALIARELHAAGKRVGVYKPVASGCELCDGKLVSPDAVALWEAAGVPTVVCGPAGGGLHTAVEWVELEQLRAYEEALAALILAFTARSRS